MIKQLFVTIALALWNPIHAQVWVDQDAEWHYDFWNVGVSGFEKTMQTGDTIIDNHLCQKFETVRYSFVTSGPNGSSVLLQPELISTNYTYTNGDTVFYRNNDNFYILFNFNANIGDEWIISTIGSTPCSDTSKLKVTDVGILNINAITYRTIDVQPTPNSSIGIKGKIVERFGLVNTSSAPFQYLFPQLFECDAMPQTGVYEWYWYNFKCFEDISHLVYNPSGEDCEYQLTHLGITKKDSLQYAIHPNPASDIILATSNRAFDTTIQIMDIHGQIIQTNMLNSNNNFVDVSQFENGIYFLIDKTTGSTSKLIIQH